MKGILAQYYFIKYIVLIFTVVLLLIVCVGVINAVFLSVSERTREIGTMMAMGAKKRSIVSLFMLEGTILSLLSSLSGAAVGVALIVLAMVSPDIYMKLQLYPGAEAHMTTLVMALVGYFKKENVLPLK